jgi:hypothetical protein
VLSSYPKHASWLRELIAISSELSIIRESFPRNRDRARECFLNAVAHSSAPSDFSSGRQFGFASAKAAVIMVGVLGLMAGAAAAAGVNLRAVPGSVIDTLAQPLPLSAEMFQNLAANANDRGADQQHDSGGDGRVAAIVHDGANSTPQPTVQAQCNPIDAPAANPSATCAQRARATPHPSMPTPSPQSPADTATAAGTDEPLQGRPRTSRENPRGNERPVNETNGDRSYPVTGNSGPDNSPIGQLEQPASSPAGRSPGSRNQFDNGSPTDLLKGGTSDQNVATSSGPATRSKQPQRPN